MDTMDIWRILLTAALGVGGFMLRYIFMRLKEIVPEQDVRQMIKDGLAPEQVKQAMIYERLIHIEGKIDRLLEDLRTHGNDSGRDRH